MRSFAFSLFLFRRRSAVPHLPLNRIDMLLDTGIIFSAQGEGIGGRLPMERWETRVSECLFSHAVSPFRSKMHKTCFLLYITRASLLATLLLFFSPSCCFPLFYDPSPRLLRFSFSFSFLCFLFIRSVIHTDADVTHTAIQSGIKGDPLSFKKLLKQNKQIKDKNLSLVLPFAQRPSFTRPASAVMFQCHQRQEIGCYSI